MLDYSLHRKQTGDGSVICFEVSSSIHNDVWSYIKEVGAKTNDHFRVRIDRPFRPRRTGYRSGSARLHGHCADLAEQLTDESKGIRYSADQVKQAMKRMAASERGWPTYLDIDGTEQPMSEADASIEQETFINRVLQRFADVHGFFLTEYDDTDPENPIAYRSIGGRTRAEMAIYYQERGV